jgi:pyrroloquinoline-quinone synthase
MENDKESREMKTEEFLDALDSLVAEKHLLKHPFYTLWNVGKLTRDHIREYAISYYPHVAAFPTYVSGVHSGCDDPALRAELLENLVEEEGGPVNHPALWRRFAASLGATESDLSVSPRTAEVADAIAEFRRTTRTGSVPEGLAALYAYESQIPEISKTKREGLAAFYGIEDPEATRFFTVHEDADVWHRQVERAALGRAAQTPEDREKALAAAGRCLDALNRVLDGVMRENDLGSGR